MNEKNRFLDTKRRLFDKFYSFLNTEQRQAVYTVKGPLLVLAGAGSGKTTVLVNRIRHILCFGDAYFDDFTPENEAEETKELEKLLETGTNAEIENKLAGYTTGKTYGSSILCITFTNKAAKEFKERLEKLLGETAGDIWAGTFHSICVRILRIEARNAGFADSFTIYDTDDVKRLITQIMKELNIDPKTISVKTIIGVISRAKESCITAADFEVPQNDFRYKYISAIYTEYEKRMKAASAMDFDDIILNTVILFKNHPDILDKYANKFKYILVDEYQDTNPLQNDLVVMLGSKRGNVAVVGDDDQSIYSFRGATVDNILNFDKNFKDLKTIKLEQNYRSTSNILDAANAIIANNTGRKGKNLWTAGGAGKKISCSRHYTQSEEAHFIVSKIRSLVEEGGCRYSDFAVLYRLNAMANAVESAFTKTRTPYRVYGGIRFFERKEIKDIIAYLSVVSNENDDVRLRRIINVPKRQIGDSTVDILASAANFAGISMFEAIKNAENIPALSRSAAKLEKFYSIICDLKDSAKTFKVSDLVKETIYRTGYFDMLLEAEEKDKAELLTELVSTAVLYEESSEAPTLAGFLEEISLVSDIDNYDESSDAVSMMTVHSAKGLEFPVVFIAGMEEGVFPSAMSATEGKIEEERRLAYVAITRAKRELYVTYTQSRLLYGFTTAALPSPFLAEIPDEFKTDETVRIKSSPEDFNVSKKTKGDFFTKAAPKPQEKFNFKAGDRVSHKTFGNGTVTDTEAMGGDMLLGVEFDGGEIKKLMASFAKLERI